MLRTYSQTILDTFKSAIKGNRKAFQSLLTTEKRPELAAFSNAIKGDKQAEVWLKARGSAELGLICRALDYDDSAMAQLKYSDDKFDISFVLACQNRIEGKYWLTQNGYSHFFPICEAIADAVITREKDSFWWYRGWFGASN